MQWERECGFLALKIGLGRTSWLITPHTYLQPGVNLRTLYLISRFNKNTFKSPLSNLHSFHKLNLKSTPERDTFHYSVGATCPVLAELWISRDSHGMPGASARPTHERARHWIGTARAGQQGGSQWERFVNTWSLFPINLRLPGLSRSCKAFDEGLYTIFRLLFRAGFARKLVEVLSQLLISADSYRRYCALEPVKSKVERMHLRVKGLIRDCCQVLQALLLGPNTSFYYCNPRLSSQEALFSLLRKLSLAIHLACH